MTTRQARPVGSRWLRPTLTRRLAAPTGMPTGPARPGDPPRRSGDPSGARQYGCGAPANAARHQRRHQQQDHQQHRRRGTTGRRRRAARAGNFTWSNFFRILAKRHKYIEKHV